MDVTLMGLKVIFALVYLADILIISDTTQEHARRVELFFEIIIWANFKLNIHICIIAARVLAYLGHVVCASGLSPDE
jgi:hypothetical protein